MANQTLPTTPILGASVPRRDPTFLRQLTELGRRISAVAVQREPTSLQALVDDAERLIVQTVWRMVGDNLSYIAHHLQAGRKRIRKDLAEVRQPQPAPSGPQRSTEASRAAVAHGEPGSCSDPAEPSLVVMGRESGGPH